VGAASVEGARVATYDEEIVTAGIEVAAHPEPAHRYLARREGAEVARTWPDRTWTVSGFGRYRRGLGRGLEARAALRSPALASGVIGLGADVGMKWRAIGYVPGDREGGAFALSFAVDGGAVAGQIFGEDRTQLYVLGHAHGRAWASVTLGAVELYATPTLRWERLWDRFEVDGEVSEVTSDAWGVGGGVGVTADVGGFGGERWALEVGGLTGQGASLYLGVGVTR
jgi:hypothetical protein